MNEYDYLHIPHQYLFKEAPTLNVECIQESPI